MILHHLLNSWWKKIGYLYVYPYTHLLTICCFVSLHSASINAHLSFLLICFLQLKNLSAMEVNIVRPFMVRALQAFYKHDSPQVIQQSEPVGNRQQQVVDRGPRVSLQILPQDGFICRQFTSELSFLKFVRN